MGVLLAVFIVANIDPAELLGVGTLGNTLSMLFFGWFVIFITLAAQSMPKNGNLVTDSLAVAEQAWIDFIEAFKLPPQDE